MKVLLKILFLGAIVIFMQACATDPVMMINDKGNVVKCDTSSAYAWSLIGQNQIKDCENQLFNNGYHQLH